jgi:hypothetical protein
MDKAEFIIQLTEASNDPKAIHGIFNWCDRWCERCSRTEHCTLYKTAAHITADKQDDFFKSLSMIYEATMDILKEQATRFGLDFDSLRKSDFADDYDRKKYEIRDDKGILLARQYGKQVKHWLDSLEQKDPFSMEIRMQDPMLSDCLEVIQWYQYLLEVKLMRALISQKDEVQEQEKACDSLGNAKLVLISIERNIGAWGYVYQKFREHEDEILDILVCLQQLSKIVEQNFFDVRTFIRPGLD